MEIPVREILSLTPQHTSINSTSSSMSTDNMANTSSTSMLPRRTTLANISTNSTSPSVPFDSHRSYLPVMQGSTRPIDEHCTHLTMTRLFTSDYRCANCGNLPTNGWLWVCTQDQELILEDLEDKGVVEKLDALDDIFERPSKPSKRSASARQDPHSISEEMDNKQLSQYTPAQIQQIIKQRVEVLHVARRANTGEFRRPYMLYQRNGRGLDLSQLQNPLLIHTQSASPVTKKPWFPFLGGECQTKWCHYCKPHGLERSWLSLNGIAEGELPLTAIHGLSFSLKGERTVNNVKHVSNLGLRANPTTLLKIHQTANRKPRRRYLGGISKKRSPQEIQGLGIMGSQTEPSLTSKLTDSTSKVVTESIYNRRLASKYASASYTELVPELLPRLTPLSPTNGSFPPVIPFPPTPHLTRRHSFSNLPLLSVVIDIPLPDQTEEEIQSISRPSSPTNDIEDYVQAQDELEYSVTAATLTAMEKEELNKGEGISAFSSEPLKVDGGVALVEESVEEHVPDVMTQF